MTLLTRQQAAARLEIGLRTLDRLISRGVIPAYRVGPKLVRLREDDLEKYITRQQVAPAPARPETVRPCLYVPGMDVV